MSVQLLVTRGVLRMLKPQITRTSLERAKKDIVPSPPKGIAGEEVTVDGVRCVWLAREQASAGVVVYLHGGAYVTGPAKVHWQWLDATVRATGLAGLLVDYGLAPDRPYPHGLDDVMAVLASLRGDGAPLVIAGDSAGGGLAAAVCLRLRDEGLPLPSAALLISPWVDITMTDPRGAELQKRDCMLSVRMLDMAAASYSGEHDRKHPYLSPLFGDMTGLPPTLVHLGTREMFVPEDSDFVRRCRDAGVVVSLIETPGGCHASAVAVAWLPEARAVHEQMVEFVRQHIAPKQVS